jgi:methylase of polypeptide subunit release factors
LLFYRRIRELASKIAIPGGAVVLEIGGDYQATAVAELFSESAFDSVAIVKDYSGQSRVIIAELAK